jgi:hypothetical protein
LGSRPLLVLLAFAAILDGRDRVNAASRSLPSFQDSPFSEKTSRTPAQQKIDSQVLYEIYRIRGQAAQKNVPTARTGVKIDVKHRALVDVRADVTPELQKKVGSLKGTIVSTSREYRSIIAWIPLLKLERLAEDRRVSAIGPPAAMTVR